MLNDNHNLVINTLQKQKTHDFFIEIRNEEASEMFTTLAGKSTDVRTPQFIAAALPLTEIHSTTKFY